MPSSAPFLFPPSQDRHLAAHQAALEAAGLQGQQPGTVTSSATTVVTTSSNGKAKEDSEPDSDSEPEPQEEEEPSLDEVIAQLSTHGADYLRNLGRSKKRMGR